MSGLLLLGIGVAIGYSAAVQSEGAMRTFDNGVRQNTRQSRLTNPLLECRELPESVSLGERLALQKEVEKLVHERKQARQATEIAVYFRDLNNGPWFGVNEDKTFSPASLLKVPLAMSFFKRADHDPSIMTTRIEYAGHSGDVEAHQPFVPKHALKAGAVYSVPELLELMLQESSNEAALVLVEIAGEEQIRTVYEDFGQNPPQKGAEHFIDVHTYGSFFRILYNATYLDREASEQLIAMLARSTFTEGIAAGVPKDIVVAHKFGTREIEGQAGSKQLHDCGIVYAKNSPYILCVMTQGDDYSKLSAVIKDISALVYSYIK